MKLFIKLMIAVLVIGLLLPFTILKGRDGNTLMSFSDLRLPDFSAVDVDVDLPSLPKISNPAKLQTEEEFQAADESLDGKDVFYRWYDAEGNVQFTTDPPPQGIEYTLKGYDPDANVIQAVDAPPGNIASDGNQSEPANTSTSSADDIGNPYTKESIEKLFKDAKNIEKLLNQRLQSQDPSLNN